MKPSSPVPSTMWTRIIEVIQNGDPEAADRALAEFCERYRPALVAFFRQRGCKPDDAEDFAQEFFRSRILAQIEDRSSFIHEADRNRGSPFRNFLFRVLQHFYWDELRKRSAQRVGGGIGHEPWEDHHAPVDGEAARAMERQFDCALALEIIKRAAERSTHSEEMLAHLRGSITQAEAAARLDLSEGAFKQAYHRFRQRFPRDLRDEVSRVLHCPEKAVLEEEIRYLMSLFGETKP